MIHQSWHGRCISNAGSFDNAPGRSKCSSLVGPDRGKVRRNAIGTLGLFATSAFADSISPTTFSADLGLGDTVDVTKTVMVAAGGPTSAPVDIVFVFDTTGSMGSAIAGAKATATSVLNTLNTTYGGGLLSGAGHYNDPCVAGLDSNLTATLAPHRHINTYRPAAAGLSGNGL